MSARRDSGTFLGRHHQRQLTAVGRRESNSRVRFNEFNTGKEAVGEMMKRKFIVKAGCPKCGVHMWVDLGILRALLGPRISLWNRHPYCKTVEGHVRCAGRVTFYAKTSYGICEWFPLCDPPPTPQVFDRASGRPEPPLPGRAA